MKGLSKQFLDVLVVAFQNFDEIAETRKEDATENSASRRVNASRGQGLAARTRLSQLDAAVEILKDAKEPLTCKEIVRRIFGRKIWSTTGRTPEDTLSASIKHEIARGKNSRFRKAERGLYELCSRFHLSPQRSSRKIEPCL